MKYAVEELKDNAIEIYMPDSFKAIIDLEFDLMMKYNIVLRKCESCGRYFVAEGDSFYCSRINSSGKTCLEQYEEMCGAIAKAAENTAAEESVEIVEEITEEAEKKVGVIPAELEKRSQKIYNALYKRAGKGMEEKEFREWSRYLSDLKRNIKICEATIEEFEEFLDYSDRLCDEVKNAQKNKSAAKAEFNYPDNKNNAAAEPKPEPVRVISAKTVEVKPYTPEAFDNLFDTFMSEHTAEVLNERFAETGQIGFIASKRLDGKLILPEAIKVLQQKGTSSGS